MGLQDFFKDAKNILLGNSDEISREDFKKEIEMAVKSGLITKADAAELMQTRKNLKKEASELEKKQLATISLEDGSKVSVEDAKKKKEELDRKKREKEQQKQNSVKQIENNNKPKIPKNPKTKSGRLTIDRSKLQKQIEIDEKEDKSVKLQGREDKN